MACCRVNITFNFTFTDNQWNTYDKSAVLSSYQGQPDKYEWCGFTRSNTKMERSGAKWPKAQMKTFNSHRIRVLFWTITHIQNQAIAQINICKNYTPSSTLIIEVKVPIYQNTQRHIHKLIIYKAICRYYNKITMKLFSYFNACTTIFYYFVLWPTKIQLQNYFCQQMHCLLKHKMLQLVS